MVMERRGGGRVGASFPPNFQRVRPGSRRDAATAPEQPQPPRPTTTGLGQAFSTPSPRAPCTFLGLCALQLSDNFVMNTRAAIDDSPCPTALSVAFNQDFSCFSVALENGFRVYSAPACECLKARDLGQGLGCAEMLGKMNYLALVGGGKSPKYAQNKVCLSAAIQTTSLTSSRSSSGTRANTRQSSRSSSAPRSSASV